MTLEFHPAVQSDFDAAIAYYESQGGLHLADRFEREFRDCVAAIAAAPTRFSLYLRSDKLRRIHFRSFPYVVVYRETPGRLRVLILKHERRHPHFGAARR